MSTFYAKETLPKGYSLHEKIDLAKNRRQFWIVNGLSVLLAILCAAPAVFLNNAGLKSLENSWRLLAAAAGCLVYIVAHEAVHGVLMWLISRKKPRFGLTLTYAYAGSDMYFAKGGYLLIALAPLVCLGLLLGALALALPAEWFWPVWIIQIMNVSGSAGDVYVFGKMLCKSDQVLVQDTGTAMSVYLPG